MVRDLIRSFVIPGSGLAAEVPTVIDLCRVLEGDEGDNLLNHFELDS
jgi:hypothetical protein